MFGEHRSNATRIFISAVCLCVFMVLAAASSESDSEKQSRVEREYNLTPGEFGRGVSRFGSAGAFERTLKFAREEGVSLDRAVALISEFGSIEDYRQAKSRNMNATSYRQYKAQVEACRLDWRHCADNAQLVNSYRDWSRVVVECKSAAQASARFGDPEFPWLPFGTFLNGNTYVNTGIAVAIEPRAQFFNGFGAKVNSRVTCRYDLNRMAVVEVNVAGF